VDPNQLCIVDLFLKEGAENGYIKKPKAVEDN
jgi:hypothetical protein